MDYKDGFEDGVKFTREVIINNIRAWASDCIDGAEGQIMDDRRQNRIWDIEQ